MGKYSELCNDIVDFGNKNSNPRKDTVCKITPHHMAMVCGAKRCAEAHYSREVCSANYYIGNNGEICGGVSEDRRAWTSGTGNAKGSNDHMAITIEVSNSGGAPDWPISDRAYDSLVALCADICKRYNINPHFDGTPNGTITVHNFFARTACPGPTLQGKIVSGELERDIKALIEPAPAPAGKSDEEKIWDYLYERIGNAYGVAGLMGNLYAESGLRSNNLQNTYERSLGMTDVQYTAAVDSGAYSKDAFVNDKAGYGLAQWTFWSRKENLYNSKGSRSIGDLNMQLEYLWEELSMGYKTTLNVLKTATSVYQASTAVLVQFERPRDQSEAMKQKRASYGQVYYDKYAGSSPQPVPQCPYIVRVTCNTLNVRKGPGTNYAITTQVHKGEAYTIMEEQDGWGRLKSGVGWICLEYTQKI